MCACLCQCLATSEGMAAIRNNVIDMLSSNCWLQPDIAWVGERGWHCSMFGVSREISANEELIPAA